MNSLSIQHLHAIGFNFDPYIELFFLCRSWRGVLGFSLKPQEDGYKESTSDHGIIFRAQRGDSDAFRQIIECYQSHVSKLLWRFTRDKTVHEELVQECFVQVYFSLKTYKKRAPFEHWISRIATRVGYRYWKQTKRHTQ